MIREPFTLRRCVLFEKHTGDPCKCGASSRDDLSDFAQDLVFIVERYKKENGISYQPSIGELLRWISDKIWEE